MFVVRTSRFAESLAFYADVLGLDLVEEWTDFGHGAVLAAGGIARIEIIELDGATDAAPDAGAFLGLQVTNVDELHERAVGHGSTIASDLQERPWGGRGFALRDPNGIGVNVYSAYDSR